MARLTSERNKKKKTKKDIRGSKIDWKTHMKGMRELVRLRGGIDELDSNEALRVTLSW